MESAVESGLLSLYSLALAAVLVAGAPYWLLRMATSGRYRAGLRGRFGRVPADLKAAVAGRRVVWLHAVSVGEVFAATRLVRELEERLGDAWIIVVSTTTATGQALARERFGAQRVFWYPLDLAFALRRYLRVLRPGMLVLMESELWPRMLMECTRTGSPVAVVNARVSDRSYRRGIKVRAVWGRLLRRVTLFLAQSEEDARRLIEMGARPAAVKAVGNLKYDVHAPRESRLADHIRELAGGRSVLVAGSTVNGVEGGLTEERLVVDAWKNVIRQGIQALLVLAPRHPQRFEEVAALLGGCQVVRASSIGAGDPASGADVVLIDTIGDLASVYRVATLACIGGSLAPRGGHNPLEAARFGVPVITGPSVSNFRDVYSGLASVDGVHILAANEELEPQILKLLRDPDAAKAMGERGRLFFEQQQGATSRTVAALLGLVRP